MGDRPEPTRQQQVLGAVMVVALGTLLCLIVLAANQSSRNTLREHCRTEATAPYRGAIDNERAANYIHTCT